MYPNILRLSMFMGLHEGQWTLLVSSCLRSTNRINLCTREHADSQNVWIHPRRVREWRAIELAIQKTVQCNHVSVKEKCNLGHSSW